MMQRDQSNRAEIQQAIQDAQAATRDAAQSAREAARTAREAARSAQQGDGEPGSAQRSDQQFSFKGIEFGDGHPPVTVDIENGKIVLHQGTQTATVPWQDAVPRGAVQIAWAVPATLSILVIWWPLTRAVSGWLRRKGAVAQDTAALEARLRERFETIERNVDTVAVEIEKLAEGQRFTNRLIAERPAAPMEVPVSVPASVPVSVPVGAPRAASRP